jgi:hypothetical protein
MLFKIYSRLGLFLIRAHQLHRLDAGVGRADIFRKRDTPRLAGLVLAVKREGPGYAAHHEPFNTV